MVEQAKEIYDLIQNEISRLPMNEFMLSTDEENVLRSKKIDMVIDDQ